MRYTRPSHDPLPSGSLRLTLARVVTCGLLAGSLAAAGGQMPAPAGAAPDPRADGPATPVSGEGWQLAGRRGIAQYIVVAVDGSKERATYDRIAAQVCESGQSCFLSFFTNTTGAPVALPLPDAIDHEATAIFRRSIKQGGEQFRWSCRLGLPTDDCF